MARRNLFAMIERPLEEDGGEFAHLDVFRAQPINLIGTTLLACMLGAIFAAGCLVSILLHEPPAPRLADNAPSDAVSPTTSAVEAALVATGAGR